MADSLKPKSRNSKTPSVLSRASSAGSYYVRCGISPPDKPEDLPIILVPTVDVLNRMRQQLESYAGLHGFKAIFEVMNVVRIREPFLRVFCPEHGIQDSVARYCVICGKALCARIIEQKEAALTLAAGRGRQKTFVP